MSDVWDLLNGKKVIIGGILFFILRGVSVIWPEFIPDNVYAYIEDVIAILTGVGIGHKIYKNERDRKTIRSSTEDNQ